jgi:hypothetical protein
LVQKKGGEGRGGILMRGGKGREGEEKSYSYLYVWFK